MKRSVIRTHKEWDRIVEEHIDGYANTNPRYGIKMKQIMEKYEVKPRRVLEVAAHSAKDSRYLASEFQDGEFHTVDFSGKSVEWVKKANAKAGLKNIYPLQANAFNLPFKDRAFDISFNADFYIYFGQNDLSILLKEQKRVTKDLTVIFVHNKYSARRLIFWFLAKTKRDPWWQFKGFSLKELRNIFADQEILATGGVDSYVLRFVNELGETFIGRLICPKFLRDKINRIEFLRRHPFWEIIYLVIKVGN